MIPPYSFLFFTLFRWSGYFADGKGCLKFGEIGLQKRGVVDRDDSVAVDVSCLLPQIVKRVHCVSVVLSLFSCFLSLFFYIYVLYILIYINKRKRDV